MLTQGIFSNTFSLLERSLNFRSLQHQVLTSNIANMDTPNYKAVELDVAEEMNKNKGFFRDIQLKRTHTDHLPIIHHPMDTVKLKASKPTAFSLRGDGNTVDVDRTMGRLAENTMLYNTAIQLISRKFRGLKNAITGDNK